MTVTSEVDRVWKEAISKSNLSVQCLFGWLWTMIWDMEGKKKEVPLHAMRAQRGRRVITLLIFDPSAGKGQVVSATSQPRYPQEGDPVPILQAAGWAS